MKRAMRCLVAMGLVASACGSSDRTSAPEPSVEAVPTTSGTPATALERTDDGDVGYDGDPIGPDPIAAGPIWGCNGQVTLTLDELLAFDTPDQPSDEQFAIASQYEPLGTASDWVVLSDRWIADRRLLDSDPGAMVIGDTVEGGAFACVPIRQTSMRPVAWELVAPSVDGEAVLAVESCIDPDALVVDARPVADQLLVGAFVPYDTPTGASCVVDGTTTISIPSPEGVDIVSSQRWPFEVGDPGRWYVDRRHPPVVPLDDASFADLTCTAAPSSNEIFVSFVGMPPGVSTAIFADGNLWLEHEEQLSRRLSARIDPSLGERFVEYGGVPWSSDAVFSDGGYSFFGAMPGDPIDFELRISVPGGNGQVVSCGTAGLSSELPAATCSISTRGGQPMLVVDDGMQGLGAVAVFRDGEPLDLGLLIGFPVDVTAESGVEHEYEIEVSDPFTARDSTRTPCGSFTVVDPSSPTEEVRWASELFQGGIAGPYLYVTVVDPAGTEIDVAMVPASVGYEFLAPDNPPLDADPTTVHARLIESLVDGRDVTFTFDSWSGVPTQWSIDGVRYRILCLSFDTAPLELRDIECDPSSDLIGIRR